jgi:hypothetical protein
MLSNIIKFEVKLDEKVYTLLCDNDSPLIHVKEAIFQIQKCVGQIEDNIKSQQESAKTDQPTEPVVKEETQAEPVEV